MATCIVKVQMPLAGDMSLALVYNQDRSVVRQFPVSKFETKMKGANKKFFRAQYTSHSFDLGAELPDQGW